MATMASMSLVDAEATPVTHVLYPVSNSWPLTWRERLANVPAACQVNLVMRRTTAKDEMGIEVVNLRFGLPVMESITNQNSAGYTAPSKIAYVITHDHRAIIPMRSTEQQRLNARKLFADALGNSQVIDAITKLEYPY